MTLNFSQLFLFFKDNKLHTISHTSHLLYQPTIEVLMKAVRFRLSTSINFEYDEVKLSMFGHYEFVCGVSAISTKIEAQNA